MYVDRGCGVGVVEGGGGSVNYNDGTAEVVKLVSSCDGQLAVGTGRNFQVTW